MHLDSEAWFPSPYFPQKLYNKLTKLKLCPLTISGETKIWQYITFMRRIYLIDCPGVVYPYEESNTEKVLKGVVRVELVENPEDYIEAVLARVKKAYIAKTYKIDDWEDAEDFLTKMARKTGKLMRGGEPELNTVAKMVLNDWQRGKLPYFTIPPGYEKKVDVQSTPETSGSAPSTPNGPVPVTEEDAQAQVTTGGLKKPNLIQNLKKILVQLDYEGEDLQPEDEEMMEDDTEIFDSDDGGGSEEEEDEEVEVENEGKGPESSDSDQPMLAHQQKSSQSPQPMSTAQLRKKLSKRQKQKKKTLVVQQRKNFVKPSVVKSRPEVKPKSPASSSEPSASTTLANGGGGRGKRKRDDELTAQDKMTSKQKRSMERENKRKKVGSNFYEVTNVKNRNRDRKVPKAQRPAKPKAKY